MRSMNTLVTVSCTVKNERQTSPKSRKVALQNRFRHPLRTASCGALFKNEFPFQVISKKKKKKSFEVSSNPEVTESDFLEEDSLHDQYGMCKTVLRKPSICSYPPSYAHLSCDAVPEIKICGISHLIQTNPKRNTVINLNPQGTFTSPLSPVKVFSSRSLLPTSQVPALTSSPTTNRYSFCESSCEDDLKYIDEPSVTNILQPTEQSRPFSISPSYQSDLSDCSFFPPTASSYKYYSPQSPSIQEENEFSYANFCRSNCSLGEDLTGERTTCSPNPYSSSSQLCPCAMATTDSCANCARGLTFPLSPIHRGWQWDQVPERRKLKSILPFAKLEPPKGFHIYFTLGFIIHL